MNAIFEYINRIGPQERLIVLIELMLIGVIVYIAISFLEGTRGERLFRGVISVLVVGTVVLYLVVEKFKLARVQYLYSGFLFVISIIAIVAFQPEIRRALIRIGQASFLTSSSQQLSRSVEEIISAVTQLAATRTGAIIVVEQQVGLGEFIDTGVKIDSKVTAELIKTIFHPGTPLHDMAIVVQGDRIIAARVQLPLAEAESFKGRQIGSRHRAAIGVTSGSDATVIIVSEETGIISLALDGNLIRNVSEAQLRRYLNTAVVETTPIVERMKQTETTSAKVGKKTENRKPQQNA
ncbi:MAG TPA: TIGR00159 family protein [Phycisphaerales bacterium]|nr:TIGR00159 family protein [Phycisphaerales bacterium]